ncbi:MAG: hypothetical protein JXB23_04730 [Candidatus Aminicenantes bacterium]|nr:hypothetical protein [Candidatus Aminicenantes bacterium]
MDNQVLVTYATKHGATAEIAEKIGQVLRQAGLGVDVLGRGHRRGDQGSRTCVCIGIAITIC